jgi:hypothetical protein
VISLPVHPAADIFPMMSPEELQELGATIVADGQEYPIMLSHDGKQLVDGRNRLAACELAKIEPTYAKLAADQDPVAYIYSFNIMHRFLNKGQRAMAMAMLYPDHGERGRGKKSAAIKSVETTGISRSRLDQARSVLRFSRPIAQAVLNGTTPLDAALVTVKEQEQYQMGDEAKLTRLRESAPDLAEQVNEERLKIDEAIAACRVLDTVGPRVALVMVFIQALDRLMPPSVPANLVWAKISPLDPSGMDFCDQATVAAMNLKAVVKELQRCRAKLASTQPYENATEVGP